MNSEQIQAAVERINGVKGVSGARAWTKVTGKERIYFETASFNGGRNWNGGVGYRTAYVDMNTGSVVLDGEAGAKTRNWHADNETAEKVAAAFAAAEVAA